MAVRIKRDRVMVTNLEYCWVWFSKIIELSSLSIVVHFSTTTVVSFWLRLLPTQSPFKNILWYFQLFSVCLHAGFTCIFLTVQYRYTSSAQPELPLDNSINSVYICICLSLIQLKNLPFASNYACWKPSQVLHKAELEADPDKILSYQFVSDKNNSFALINIYMCWWWNLRR